MKKLIFFLPALTAAAFYGFVLLGLGASPSSIEPGALFAVQVLFAAGILLCIGRWWGGIPGAGVGAALLWWNAQYRGHRHIDLERPAGIALLLFYTVCGAYLLYKEHCPKTTHRVKRP